MHRFAVVGHPVGHSLSPVMHEANFKSLRFEGSYEKFDVSKQSLKDFLLEKRAEGYLGVNVTIPYKREVIGLLDVADSLVTATGSCNTLKFGKDGQIEGYNTDVEGFLSSLSKTNFALKGKKVLLVGCGGAGQSIALACSKEGVAAICLASRSQRSIASIKDKICASGFGGEVSCLAPDVSSSIDFRSRQWGKASLECDLIVNASPIGLALSDESVLSPECFSVGQVFFDIVPVGRTTPSVAAALAAGATVIDGLEFLVSQGAKSFEIWTGLQADRQAMLEAVRKVRQ